MDNNFIYGIAKLEVGSVGANNAITYAEIGYIEKGSFQWGGSAPESVDVEAEQVPSAPVLILRQKNGTIAPQFNLIQLDVNNLKAVMGGTLSNSNKTWNAPSELVTLTAPVKITTQGGAVISIANAEILANLSGNLTLTEVSKIQVTLKVLAPASGSPYSIDFTPEA